MVRYGTPVWTLTSTHNGMVNLSEHRPQHILVWYRTPVWTLSSTHNGMVWILKTIGTQKVWYICLITGLNTQFNGTPGWTLDSTRNSMVHLCEDWPQLRIVLYTCLASTNNGMVHQSEHWPQYTKLCYTSLITGINTQWYGTSAWTLASIPVMQNVLSIDSCKYMPVYRFVCTYYIKWMALQPSCLCISP